MNLKEEVGKFLDGEPDGVTIEEITANVSTREQSRVHNVLRILANEKKAWFGMSGKWHRKMRNPFREGKKLSTVEHPIDAEAEQRNIRQYWLERAG